MEGQPVPVFAILEFAATPMSQEGALVFRPHTLDPIRGETPTTIAIRMGLGCIVLLLAACDGGPRETGTAVRDSAGVTIVDSYAPRWDQSGPSIIADDILLRVGAVEGSEADELFRVRKVRWLDANHFGFSNSDTEVRVYDLRGDLVHQFGREGEGPGEYKLISEVSPLQDGRLLLADSRLRRITVTNLSGDVVHTTEAQGPLPPGPDLVGDRWLVGIKSGTGNSSGPRIDRLVDSVVAVNVDTGERAAWTTTPGVRVDWRRFPNGLMGPFNFMISPGSTIDGRGDRVVYGSSDVYELKELNSDGELVRIFRRHVQARAVTDEHKSPVLEVWTERGSPPYAEPVFPDSLPHFRAILLDDAGRTWVQKEEGWSVPAPEWDVFGSDGGYLGRVLLPDGFQPHDFLGDKLVGVWRDSLDVEYVQVRRVIFPGRLSPDG